MNYNSILFLMALFLALDFSNLAVSSPIMDNGMCCESDLLGCRDVEQKPNAPHTPSFCNEVFNDDGEVEGCSLISDFCKNVEDLKE